MCLLCLNVAVEKSFVVSKKKIIVLCLWGLLGISVLSVFIQEFRIRTALNKIEVGMTEQEVEVLLGPPDFSSDEIAIQKLSIPSTFISGEDNAKTYESNKGRIEIRMPKMDPYYYYYYPYLWDSVGWLITRPLMTGIDMYLLDPRKCTLWFHENDGVRTVISVEHSMPYSSTSNVVRGTR